METSMSTLSVAIIMKNEEKVVERCLTCVSKLADEIILVDSVASYCPVILRSGGLTRILSIEELFDFVDAPIEKTQRGEEIKRCEHLDIEVWHRMKKCRNGQSWTKLNGVLRHPYSGKILRVNTLGGLIDVTPNHSLFSSRGREIPASSLTIGSKILEGELHQCHDTGKGRVNKMFLGTEDLAWTWGLFAAEGSAYEINGYHKVKWSNSNREFLEKCQTVMERDMCLNSQKITNPDPIGMMALICNGDTVFNFFRERFYDAHGEKRVPVEILNAPENIRKSFLDGYMAGDGHYGENRYPGYTTKSWLLAQGILWIWNSLGYHNSCLHIREDKKNIIDVRLNVTDTRLKIPYAVKRIWEMDYDGMVYDLSTADGKFQAGVGAIFAHNTGSTDRTKELAEKYPKCQVFDSAFFDKDTHFSDFEFGKAKNEAVKRCTKDWVMWFDADDFIDDENVAKAKQIIDSETRVSLYSFEIVYGPLRFEHCRLFKNGAGILFDEGHSCHEYLNSNGNPLVIRRDVKIQHLPEHKGVSSAKRNIAIMEKDYFVRKRDDQRTLFYLANGYREDGQIDKAIDFYNKYLEKSVWREERYFARFYKAQCLISQGKVDESRDEICLAMAEDFRFAESFCFLGDVFFQKQEHERAIQWYKMAMNTPYPKDARLFVSSSSYSQYPTTRIGECMAKLGAPGQTGPKPDESTSSTKRCEKFFLPEDRGLAMLAVMALSNCASAASVSIEVVTNDPWQKGLVQRFDKLKLGEGSAKSLSLPAKLKGKHVVEWYIRSAGFMLPMLGSVRVANTVKRGKGLVLLTEDIVLPNSAMELIRAAGKNIRVIGDKEDMEPTMLLFKDGVAFIGHARWHYHFAQWTHVPGFVFYDGRDEKEYGWTDQENRKKGDFSGLDEFLKRSLQ